MNISESFKIAIKCIRANWMRSLLTMLGIIIGISSVIMIIGAGTGVRDYIVSLIEDMGALLQKEAVDPVVPGLPLAVGVDAATGDHRHIRSGGHIEVVVYQVVHVAVGAYADPHLMHGEQVQVHNFPPEGDLYGGMQVGKAHAAGDL